MGSRAWCSVKTDPIFRTEREQNEEKKTNGHTSFSVTVLLLIFCPYVHVRTVYE